MNRSVVAKTVSLTLLILSALGACATQQKTDSPKARAERTPPVEPWRDARPAAGAPADPVLPTFQRAQLKNGLTVIVAEEHALPIVDMRVVVLAGSVVETPAEAGLAALTFDLLDEGAGEYNALSLADAFAKLGTEVGISSGVESGTLSLSVLKRNADEGLGLLSTLVQKPTFGADDFERVKEQRLSQLKQRVGNPGVVSSDVFYRGAYGMQHPYGKPSVGTLSSLQGLSHKRVKKFWTDFAGPANTAVVFAGDVTLDEATALAQQHFGMWRGKAKRPKVPVDPPATKLSIQLVDFPGAPQTIVRIGRPLLKKGDPDEASILMMNQILGGMFSSRLNMKLREEKRWTYGASSSAQAMRAKGPLMAGAGIERQHTAAALNEFFAEFAKMSETPVSEEELGKAKDNYIKSLPGLFETVGATAGAASGLFVYDLPLDYYATRPEVIAGVTTSDVQAAAVRALVKDEMVIVLTGDAASIEEEVRALDLAEVKRVSATGDSL